jgi:hypothetical protein
MIPFDDLTAQVGSYLLVIPLFACLFGTVTCGENGISITSSLQKCNATDSLLQGRYPKEGGCRAAAPKPQDWNLKNRDFVDTISNVLRYFPFSRNQPLDSADD